MLQPSYFINIVQHAFEALKDFFSFLGQGMNWVWALVAAIGILLLKGWADSTANYTASRTPGSSSSRFKNETHPGAKPKLEETGIGRFILVIAIVGLLVFVGYVIATV